MAQHTAGGSGYRRILSFKFIESGYMPITMDKREGGSVLVRTCLARYGAESHCDEGDVQYSRFDVNLYNIHGTKYDIALVGYPNHRRKKEWRFVRIREWLAAGDIRDGTLVEFRHGPDGRIVFEVIAQTFPAGASPGTHGGGRKPFGAAEGNGGFVAALGQGLALPLYDEITLTQNMCTRSHLRFHPLSQLAVTGFASRLSGDRKYDVQVRDELRHDTLYECQMWPYGGDGGPGQADSVVRWRLVALGPFMRAHKLAPGDKVAVTLSPLEGPMLARVVRASAYHELRQAPKVGAEKVAAGAGSPGCKDGADGTSSSTSSSTSTSTSTSTSGYSEYTDETSDSVSSSGSSGEDDDRDDRNGREEGDDEYQPVRKDPPSQRMPVTGIKRGRPGRVTVAGASPQPPAPAAAPASAPARGNGGAAPAAVPPEASILSTQKRRRIGGIGIADGLFDPRCGKVLKDSDSVTISLSRALFSLDGVFGALMGREMPLHLTLRTKAGAEAGAPELSWQVWIRAPSASIQLRLSNMAQVIHQFGMATGDVILFAATDDPLTYTITCWRVSASSAAPIGGTSGLKLEQLWPSFPPRRRTGRRSDAAAAAMAAGGRGPVAETGTRRATARHDSTSDKDEDVPLATRLARVRAPEPDGGGRRRVKGSSVDGASLPPQPTKGAVVSEHALAAATWDVGPPPPPPPPPCLASGPAFADPTSLSSEPQPFPAPHRGVRVKDEPRGGEGVTGVVGVGPLLCGEGIATDHKAPLAVRNSRGCGSGWRPVNVHNMPEPLSVVATQEAPSASTTGGAVTTTTHAPEARTGPVHVALPASSITHPHGYVPDGPPSLRPGELRICGLTFHPELREAVERLQAVWMQGLRDPLARTDPIRHQMAILGVDLPLESPDGSCPAGGAAAAAAFRRHGLKRNVICNRLARMLGLMGEGCVSDSKLPEVCPAWLADVRRCEDPERGGFGLEAANSLQANVVLGVLSGYVLPDVARVELMSYGTCDPRVTAEMRRRAGEASVTAWQFLIDAFMVPYTWPSDVQLERSQHHQHRSMSITTATTSVGAAAPQPPQWQAWAAATQDLPPASISMLGYGNLAALVNDPRVEPREWLTGNDLDSPAIAEKANCVVLPVAVRGLVLPVMVTMRPVSKGEQLLYDYGSQWWRRLMDAWEMLDAECLTPAQALWGLKPCEAPVSAMAAPTPAAAAVEATFHAAADMIANDVPSAMSTDSVVVGPELCAALPALPLTQLTAAAELNTAEFADGSRRPRRSVPDDISGAGGSHSSDRAAAAAAATAAAPAATDRNSRPPPLAVPPSESFSHGDSADRAIPLDRNQDPGQSRFRDPDMDRYQWSDLGSGSRLLDWEGREIRSRDEWRRFRSPSREREGRGNQSRHLWPWDESSLPGPSDNRGQRRHSMDREEPEQEGWRREGDSTSGRRRDGYRDRAGQGCPREGPLPSTERPFLGRPFLDNRCYEHQREMPDERQRRLELRRGLGRGSNYDVGQRDVGAGPEDHWGRVPGFDDRYVPDGDPRGRGRERSVRGDPPASRTTEQYSDGGVKCLTVGGGNATDGDHQKRPTQPQPQLHLRPQQRPQPSPQPQPQPGPEGMGDGRKGACEVGGKEDQFFPSLFPPGYQKAGKRGDCGTGGGEGSGRLDRQRTQLGGTTTSAVTGGHLLAQMVGGESSGIGSDNFWRELSKALREDDEVGGGRGRGMLLLDTRCSAARCEVSADAASLGIAGEEDAAFATSLSVTEGQPRANGQRPPKASYGASTDPRIRDGVGSSGGQLQDAVRGCDAILGACTAADAAAACNGPSATALETARGDAELQVMKARARQVDFTWRVLVPYSTTSHDKPSGSTV